VNSGSEFLEHQDPVFQLGNHADALGTFELIARVTNCIVYGSQEEEIELAENSGNTFDVIFDHCYLKTKLDLSNTEEFIEVIRHQNGDSIFVNSDEEDFHLHDSSRCIDAGMNFLNAPFTDLDGVTRTDPPDIGAYEL